MAPMSSQQFELAGRPRQVAGVVPELEDVPLLFPAEHRQGRGLEVQAGARGVGQTQENQGRDESIAAGCMTIVRRNPEHLAQGIQ